MLPCPAPRCTALCCAPAAAIACMTCFCRRQDCCSETKYIPSRRSAWKEAGTGTLCLAPLHQSRACFCAPKSPSLQPHAKGESGLAAQAPVEQQHKALQQPTPRATTLLPLATLRLLRRTRGIQVDAAKQHVQRLGDFPGGGVPARVGWEANRLPSCVSVMLHHLMQLLPESLSGDRAICGGCDTSAMQRRRSAQSKMPAPPPTTK